MIQKETLGCISLLFIGFLICGMILFVIQKLSLGHYKLIDRNLDYTLIVETIKKNRGSTYINDSIEIGIAYNPVSLEELPTFVKKGDILEIRAKNDTIYILRNGKKYWFEHQSYK